MAVIEDLLAALRAVADEHGDGQDDHDVDSEVGQDATEEGADGFSKRQQQAILLVAKMELQTEHSSRRIQQAESAQARRSTAVASARNLEKKKLRIIADKTYALENELAMKKAIDAELKGHSQAYIALKRSKMTKKELEYPDPHNWREEATLEFQNRKL
jgi:hypothetical protein